MFASVIIGSVPRMGKTFLLRLLLLICALDVRCEIHAYDLKGTGDLAPLRPGRAPLPGRRRPRGHRVPGRRLPRAAERDAPPHQGHPRHRRQDQQRCPENKVTPELATDTRLGLHPIAIAVDECQVAFEHPTYGAEMETIATDLAKRGPALGIIICSPPSGRTPSPSRPGISANAVLRFCLKVMGQTENDMVLGTSQYKAGIRATMFAFEDKGVFYFGGEGRRPRIMRGQNIDGPAAKVIVARARVMREAAGRITGYALGEDGDQEVRSFAADVLMVFGADDKLWCETIAARLAGSIPSAYADITKDAVASQLRALEVDVKSVRETGKGPRAGCERAAVAAAAPPPEA